MSARRPDILLHSGNFFNFLDPDDSVITIDDIAHALSHEPRFNGHTHEFYSVAQHSVMVSMIVPPEWAWEGLFHDASEAFIKDLTKPLKRLLPDYCALEERIEKSIFGRLDIAWPLHPSIKAADMVLLATEIRDLMPPHDDLEYPGILPLEEVIVPLPPLLAKRAFLERYNHLALYNQRALARRAVA